MWRNIPDWRNMISPGDTVIRVDHEYDGQNDTMRVVAVKGRYTDCIYEDSGVWVSHPTHTLKHAS
jgi:hypothetical protein